MTGIKRKGVKAKMMINRRFFKKKTDAEAFAKEKNQRARTTRWRVEYFSPKSGYSVTQVKKR